MKPPSSLTSISPTVKLHGYQDVICETEMAILITKGVPRAVFSADEAQLISAIGGVGIAFDLTRKDLQTELKAQGKPWELAKGFDDACPISQFVDVRGSDWLNHPMNVELRVNGKLELCQPTSHLILPVLDLLRAITHHFSLWPGDIILTGTPTKPNLPPRLRPGDKLVAVLGDLVKVEADVI